MASPNHNPISPQTTVAAALGHHPEAPRVFKDMGMATCVGCVMAPFETLAEAADEFGADLDALIAALQALTEKECA